LRRFLAFSQRQLHAAANWTCKDRSTKAFENKEGERDTNFSTHFLKSSAAFCLCMCLHYPRACSSALFALRSLHRSPQNGRMPLQTSRLDRGWMPRRAPDHRDQAPRVGEAWLHRPNKSAGFLSSRIRTRGLAPQVPPQCGRARSKVAFPPLRAQLPLAHALSGALQGVHMHGAQPRQFPRGP
jgi:hypothetical protein